MDFCTLKAAALWVLVLLFLSLTSSDVAANELCVVPFESSPCPCNAAHCHTFDYYLNNSDNYFVSNTTFLFLPGCHTVYSVYDGHGVSGMNFKGCNATLLILSYNSTDSWFSLQDSAFVSFSGLTVRTSSSFYNLIAFTNVSSVEITNTEIESSNCTNTLYFSDSEGSSHLQNLTISVIYYNGSFPYMASFENIRGHINISGSKFNYSGQPLDVIAIQIESSSNVTVSIVDTEIYKAQVWFYVDDDNVFLMDNVLINGSYNIGLAIFQFSPIANVTILNSRIERVDGTALHLGLYENNSSTVVLKNLELKLNYGSEEFGAALVIAGERPKSSKVVELNNITFESNVYNGGATAFMDTVNVSMTNCRFRNNMGTALFLEHTRLSCSGHNEFIGNTADDGAGISIGEGSKLKAKNNHDTMLTFVNNRANNKGGAIYLRIDPASYIRLTTDRFNAWCFVTPHLLSNKVFHFDNNIAHNGGDNIFGGNFEFRSYYSYPYGPYYCIDAVMNMSTFSSSTSISSVASSPTRVCLCGDDGRPQCLKYKKSFSIYPGKAVTFSAFTVGEFFATVKGDVYAHILNKSSNTKIPRKWEVQNIGARNCTYRPLTYKLVTNVTNVSETLVLTAQDVVVSNYVDEAKVNAAIKKYNESNHLPKTLLYLPLFITLNTLECPRGFDNGLDGCQCAKVFLQHSEKYRVSCNIDTQTIERQYSVWIDATNTTTSYSKQCPLVYCNSTLVQVKLSNVDGADVQCLHHHTGVLCGECRKNYSLAIGSSNCLANCSNRYLSLLAVFAVAGVLLVLAIKYLNLTVTQGLISGLLFYANIVQTNKAALLSSNEPEVSAFATVIAWFNLDFGIETCFSESLDMYTKTWLQFAFPLYLWILAGAIILACRYSHSVTKLFGNNAVHVLATIFLLSYNKLLRVIITVYTVTIIKVQRETTDIENKYVWAYDGNIPYLGSKHAILFAVSTAVFLTLWLPFTVLVLLGHWLQRYNHLKGLRWLGKLRPLFDAYYGPLNDNRRYWVGILLLARVCVIFAAAQPVASNEERLLTIAFVSLVLLLLLLLFGKMYRKYHASIIEVVSFVNLMLFAVLALYFENTSGKQEIAVYISAAIFLFCLGFVLIFQCSVLVKKRCTCKKKEDSYVPINEEDELPDLVDGDRS